MARGKDISNVEIAKMGCECSSTKTKKSRVLGYYEKHADGSFIEREI